MKALDHERPGAARVGRLHLETPQLAGQGGVVGGVHCDHAAAATATAAAAATAAARRAAPVGRQPGDHVLVQRLREYRQTAGEYRQKAVESAVRRHGRWRECRQAGQQVATKSEHYR